MTLDTTAKVPWHFSRIQHFISFISLDWNGDDYFTSDSRISFARSLISCDGFMFSGSSSSCSNRACVKARARIFIFSMVTPLHKPTFRYFKNNNFKKHVHFYIMACITVLYVLAALPKTLSRQKLRPSWLDNWKHLAGLWLVNMALTRQLHMLVIYWRCITLCMWIVFETFVPNESQCAFGRHPGQTRGTGLSPVF